VLALVFDSHGKATLMANDNETPDETVTESPADDFHDVIETLVARIVHLETSAEHSRFCDEH